MIELRLTCDISINVEQNFTCLLKEKRYSDSFLGKAHLYAVIQQRTHLRQSMFQKAEKKCAKVHETKAKK